MVSPSFRPVRHALRSVKSSEELGRPYFGGTLDVWRLREAAHAQGGSVADRERHGQRHGKRQSMKAEVEHAPGTGALRLGFVETGLMPNAVNAGGAGD